MITKIGFNPNVNYTNNEKRSTQPSFGTLLNGRITAAEISKYGSDLFNIFKKDNVYCLTAPELFGNTTVKIANNFDGITKEAYINAQRDLVTHGFFKQTASDKVILSHLDTEIQPVFNACNNDYLMFYYSV